MKLLFVHQPDPLYEETQMFGIYYMPVWAYTLASHIASIEGLTVDLFDGRFEDIRGLGGYDIFAFSGINQDIEQIKRNHSNLKRRFPEATFLLGGPITWSYKQASRLGELAFFDHIFIGDGEESLVAFLREFRDRRASLDRVIDSGKKFDLSKSLRMHPGLIRRGLSRYYGAVVEVSRGCPFLCEFCDIRVLPENNRSTYKDQSLVIDEILQFKSLGVRQVLLACDNFIGVPGWAEGFCDALIERQARDPFNVSLYTWATLNISRHPRLLRKMRMAGFDMLFIGVESFHKNSLLETAKVQNARADIVESIRAIQSYGFIVVAGLIWGFDSDPPDIDELTLQGIRSSALISGEPSFLTALPGTPLHARMKRENRLTDKEFGLGRFKYSTNIKYLKDKDLMVEEFLRFKGKYAAGGFQLERFLNLLELIVASPNYLPSRTEGYARAGRVLRLLASRPRFLIKAARRFLILLGDWGRAFAIGRAVWLAARSSSASRPLWPYLKFWLFSWSNFLVKYGPVDRGDFQIDSVSAVR